MSENNAIHHMHAHPLPTVDRATAAQIQANLITYVRLFADLPGITFVESDCVWIADDGALGNHILRTDLSPEDDTPIDQQLDELVRQIGKHGDQFDWFVFPDCRPVDLGARVAAYGMAGGPDGAWQLTGQVGGAGGTWMLADLERLPPAPEVPPTFHVKQVESEPMLLQWRMICGAGFDHPLPNHEQELLDETFYMAYARHGFGPDAYSLHYIGFLGDAPVTTGTLLLADGIAGLFDIATPPTLRRQGFGSAISYAMLQEAQRHGHEQGYVWSSPMGRGVYTRVGFEEIDLGMREYQWQKR